jgi:hypothetical protein
VWRVAHLDTATPGEEIVGSAQPIPVQTSQELGRGIAVEVRQPERVRGHIPARAEPEEVGQGRVGVARLRRQDTIDRRVGVIDGRGVLRGEFGQVVLDTVAHISQSHPP